MSKHRSCKQAPWLRSALTERLRPVCTGPVVHKGVEQPIGPPRDQSSLRTEKRRASARARARKKGLRRRRRRKVSIQTASTPDCVPTAAYLACPVRWRAHERPRQAQSCIHASGRHSAGTSSHCFRSRAATTDHSAIRRIMANGGINVGICARMETMA